MTRENGTNGGGNGRLLAAGEVAALLGVPKSWVYAETRAGRIPHIALGRYRRYRRDAIEVWLANRERGPIPRDANHREGRDSVPRHLAP